MITLSVLPVDNVGRMVLAGGAAVGLGALCYYGLGMSNEMGAIERAVWVTLFCVFLLSLVPFLKIHHHLTDFLLFFPCRIWPQYVKDRIHSTYMYFAGSVGLTALSAVAVSRNPAIMGLMMGGSWMVSILNWPHLCVFRLSLQGKWKPLQNWSFKICQRKPDKKTPQGKIKQSKTEQAKY